MKKAIIISLIFIMLLICGCNRQNEENPQRLLLSASPDTHSSISFSKNDLNGNYDGELQFRNIKDVAITLNEKSYPLEVAIADGLITVEEIEAYARIDARNGLCKEVADSRNGVSHFIYCYYGICDLYFTHDIYETPNGSNPIMTYFAVCANNDLDNVFYKSGTLFSVLDGNYPIDMENWLLEFDVTDASTTGFTLNISQRDTNSQHIGQLQLVEFELYDLNDLSKSYVYPFNSADYPIEQGRENSFKITFADAEGFPAELSEGNYRMYLSIIDDFKETDLHPLMRDYYQIQGYWVTFDIP